MGQTRRRQIKKPDETRQRKTRNKTPKTNQSLPVIDHVTLLLLLLQAVGSLLLGDRFRSIGQQFGRRRVRVDQTLGAFARAHLFQRLMEEGQLALAERVGNVAQLVRVDAHVVVRDEARDELAVLRVVSGVERPQAPVRVVVGVHAHTERAFRPARGRAPVIAVVTEAVHLLVAALAVVRLGHGPFAVQLLFAPLHALLFDLAPVRLTGESLFGPGPRPRPVHVHARTQTPLRPEVQSESLI